MDKVVIRSYGTSCYTCKHSRREQDSKVNVYMVCIHPNEKHWLPCDVVTNDTMTCDKWKERK